MASVDRILGSSENSLQHRACIRELLILESDWETENSKAGFSSWRIRTNVYYTVTVQKAISHKYSSLLLEHISIHSVYQMADISLHGRLRMSP